MIHRIFALLVIAIFVPLFDASLAFAQASLPTDIEASDAVAELLRSIGGLKGASALAIVAVVVQAVMLFFRTKYASFAGKWRIVVVTGLTVVAGVLALRVAGVDWIGALLHSSTLAAVQVFGNQFVKQLTEKTS